MNISTYFENLKNLNFENNFNQKSNIDNLDSVTNYNIITADDYNLILSGISNCIECISALTHLDNGQFSKFWEDIQGYIIDLLEKKYGNRVKTFNGLTGDVWGISGIILNEKKYFPENGYIIDLPYLKNSTFNSSNKNQLLSYNGLKGNVSGISTIKINNKQLFYTNENKGNIDLGNYQLMTNGYVNTFNNVTGNVYGLYGVNVNKKTLYGPSADFYSELSTLIYENHINHWAQITGQFFEGEMSLEYQPTTIDSDDRIINIGLANEYLHGMIKKIDRKSIKLVNYKHNVTENRNIIIPLSEIEKIGLVYKYVYLGTSYVIDQNETIGKIIKIDNVIINNNNLNIQLHEDLKSTSNDYLSKCYLIYYVKIQSV